MNEGLKELKRIPKAIKDTFKNSFNIIEKELKRLEELDNGAYASVHINRYNELCNKEEALEIIKEHTLYCENVDCFVFVNTTKEVNELLKEVLK